MRKIKEIKPKPKIIGEGERLVGYKNLGQPKNLTGTHFHKSNILEENK